MRLEPELDEQIAAAAARAGQTKTAWAEMAFKIRLTMDAAAENERRAVVRTDRTEGT
jgi:hypothetical protein